MTDVRTLLEGHHKHLVKEAFASVVDTASALGNLYWLSGENRRKVVKACQSLVEQIQRMESGA